MRIALAVFLVTSSSALSQEFLTHPRFDFTPGVTADISLRKICHTKWGQDARSVTAAMKRRVVEAYNFDIATCPLTLRSGKRARRVEIDHLIPRSIGGADDERNLWPQCYEVVMQHKRQQADGAHKKDRLETFLHKELCKRPSEELLATYQQRIRADWRSLYREIYGDE